MMKNDRWRYPVSILASLFSQYPLVTRVCNCGKLLANVLGDRFWHNTTPRQLFARDLERHGCRCGHMRCSVLHVRYDVSKVVGSALSIQKYLPPGPVSISIVESCW